jgi:dihydroorotase
MPEARLTLRRPDDAHLHLREGAVMAAVLPASAAQFARAVVMPNLRPPVTTVARALEYRAAILAALPAPDPAAPHARAGAAAFDPRMALYLTEATDRDEIRRARACEFIAGVKLYPARSTTHSESGVGDLSRCEAALAEMERLGLPLLVHGEVARGEIDAFDRERVFLDEVLGPLRRRHPALKIVLEHVTTSEGVAFVRESPGPTAASITAHHLLWNRNAMFQADGGGAGLRPHFYCLPVLKREEHRRALVHAATSGDARFFLGTDSAPHLRRDKEADCGCAGCFTAPMALPLYAQAFEAAGALERLEAFASEHAAAFYGWAPNSGTITLARGVPAATDAPGSGPSVVRVGGEEIVALGGADCAWRVA